VQLVEVTPVPVGQTGAVQPLQVQVGPPAVHAAEPTPLHGPAAGKQPAGSTLQAQFPVQAACVLPVQLDAQPPPQLQNELVAEQVAADVAPAQFGANPQPLPPFDPELNAQFAPVHAAWPPEERSAEHVAAVMLGAQPFPPFAPALNVHCAVALQVDWLSVGFAGHVVFWVHVPV
jgi:hypothetical protein